MSNNTRRKTSFSKVEKDLIDMTIGKKKPKNARDEKLAQEIKDIKEQGGLVYIPHD